MVRRRRLRWLARLFRPLLLRRDGPPCPNCTGAAPDRSGRPPLWGVRGASQSQARPAAKAWIGRWLPPELERSTYVWVSSLLFFVVCRAWVDVPGVIYVVGGAWAWCSFAVQAVGLTLIYRSTAVLDVLELAGIRQIQTARATSAPAAPRQYMTGPYSIVRHPLYLGWILALFAAPTMTANRLAFAAISSVYLLVAIPWEERSIATLFGSRYHDYATRVRWRVLPGTY